MSATTLNQLLYRYQGLILILAICLAFFGMYGFAWLSRVISDRQYRRKKQRTLRARRGKWR